MKPPNQRPLPGEFELEEFLVKTGEGQNSEAYPRGKSVFCQGDSADAVFYIRKGKIKLSVVSEQGREAVIAVLKSGAFFGEGCLAGQPLRMASAVAMSACSLMRIHKPAMVRALHSDARFSEFFLNYVLTRTIRIEEDLVDHLFNSSEKRLARVLLLLANFGQDGIPEPVIAHVSQETLAEMIGTTRSRVSFFMNKFRRLGFVDYNGGKISVHSSLMNVILHD